MPESSHLAPAQRASREARADLAPKEANPSRLAGDVEELRRRADAREFLAAIVESSPDAIVGEDLDGRIRSANPAAERMFGCGVDELVGRSASSLYPASERDAADAARARARAGEAVHRDAVVVREGGEHLRVSLALSPVRDQSGQVVGLSAILRQATERRDVGERHRSASLYARNLIEASLDPLVTISPDGKITDVNRATEEVTGVPRDRLVGTDFADYFTEPEEARHGYREVLAEGLVRDYPLTIRHVSGRTVPVLYNATVYRNEDGELQGVFAAARDVTERRRAEAALGEAQGRLKRILATAGEGIWVFDAEGRTVLANARAGEFFGFDPELAPGRRAAELSPEGQPFLGPEEMEALWRGDEGYKELTLAPGSSSERHLLVSAAPLLDAAGRPDGAVAVFTDMTDYDRARQQLLHAQKMEAVGRLASGVAHDFNNVLAVILSSASFILQGLPERDPRVEDVTAIQEAGDRAAHLVRQLLTFARKAVATPVPTDLNRVVTGIERLLRRTLGEDVEVILSLEPVLSPTRVDPGQVEQVLMNLSVNARDAMPEGGELRISTRAEDVAEPPRECPDLAPGRYVVLEVSDTGGGMTPDVLSHVFEPFFTTKQLGKGTGLGLPTVLGIVKQARGDVGVISSPGAGTTVRVYLPACDHGPLDAAEPAPPVRAVGHGEVVLVVEDDDAVRSSVCRMMSRSGFVPLAARNGDDACHLLEDRRRVDVVLSDAVMPGLSGAALRDAVQKTRPGLPFVFMSGYEDLASAPARAGLVLAKPFSEQALARRLLEALASAPS